MYQSSSVSTKLYGCKQITQLTVNALFIYFNFIRNLFFTIKIYMISSQG
jgi:hypothetical protein